MPAACPVIEDVLEKGFKPQMKRVIAFITLCLLLSACHIAQGAITTFATRSAFDSAVTGQTVLDFEAQNTAGPTSFNSYGTNLTIGPVSFTQANGRIFVFGEDYSGYDTNGLTSAYVNHNDSGTANMIVNFAGGGVYSVGMDIGQQYPWHGPVGSLSMTLSSGDVINLTGLQQLAFSNNTLTFIGFVSDTAITSINFNDPSKSTAIDNFAYSANPPTSSNVPEPATCATWSLFVASALGFGLRRKSKSV